MPQNRYHIRLGEGRTTVTLDRTLAELLALHLAGEVAHEPVRAWCQEQIDADPAAFEGGASQRLAHHAVLAIARPSLRDKWESLLVAGSRRRAKR